jgi:hypothetical protein
MSEADPEAAYYQTIEEFFVGRRGDSLMLSNADWTLIRIWRRAGIPLRVVLRGISDAMDAHEHSWSRKQRVGSLRYCAAEVQAAAARWGQALGSEGEALPSALRGFADALRGARGLGPRAAAVASELSADLDQRALLVEPTREAEAWLQSCEARLLDALSEDEGAAAEKALLAALEKSLLPYKERLPRKILEQVRRDGRARRLLESKGLPRFSLFHL